MHKQTRYASGISYELDRHGGVQAKNWRRKVANSAKRPPKVLMRTLSFPLDLKLPVSEFDASDLLYNTVEGFEEGSLGYLLLSAHLSGFSLFQNAKQAASARKSSQFPNAQFVRAMEDGLGLRVPDLTPQFLFDLFQSVPRKNPTFNAEEIADRIHSGCFGKKMSEKTDEYLRDFLLKLGNAVASAACDYPDLKNKAAEALAAIGKALKQESPLFPDLNVNLASDGLDISLAYEGVVDSVADNSPKDYWLHHVIACLLRKDPSASPAQIQDALLSFSNNALSQIFGSLLFSANGKEGYLRTVDFEQFLSDLGVPATRKADAARFLKAAKSIPRPPLFNEGGYSNYRPAVAGKLRSWVSNYISRLGTLQIQVNTIKDATLPITEPIKLSQILSGLNISMQDMLMMQSERQRAINEAGIALQVLLGIDSSKQPIDCAQKLEQELKTISDIHGTYRSVLNQIKQYLEEEEDAELQNWRQALAVSESDVFVLPRISGGTPEVEESLDEINQKLRFLFSNLEVFSSVIKEKSTGGIPAYIRSICKQELQRAAQVPTRKLTDEEADLLAKRRLLQGLYRLSGRLSPQRKDLVIDWLKPVIVHSGVRDGEKIFNRLKHNGQGRLYQSPWSPSRHQPLPICIKTFDATLWQQLLQDLQGQARTELTSKPNPLALQDYLELLRFGTELGIHSIDGAVLVADLAKRIPIDNFDLHFKLKLAFSRVSVDAADLSSFLAWLGAQLSKMRFFARREQFIVRHKFSRVGQDDLILVPKDKQWQMPRKYLAAKSGIGPMLRKYQLVKEDEPVNSIELFKKASAISLGHGSSHLLKQLPHDWYLPLDLRSSLGSDIDGLPVGKESVRNPEKVRRTIKCKGAKLVGPSSYLTQLSVMLTGETEAKEWMLILDWVYQSSLAFTEGAPKIISLVKECNARVAVPIEQVTLSQESIGLFENVVAIDLGERQVGYAVFSVKQALSSKSIDPLIDPLTQSVANGAISIAGVKSLINSVKAHRGRQASNTKLKQNYDRGLEMMRNSVGSEIVQRIEALCARFNAFPVLESSVVNFQTGSRQLDLVYGDVVRHFTYSGVDAHKNARKEHWMGAEQWVHPYLMAKSYDEATQKRSGKAKPLNLFPGSSVHPAGTSQTCIKCQRNSREALKQLGEKIVVRDDGVVDTDLGTIRLLVGQSYPADIEYHARKNKRNLPNNTPLKSGTYSLKEMLGFEGRARRQKNPSQMARDTTQSRFQCLFSDCRATYHADAGAAVNIGRKFFSTIIDIAESKNQMSKN